MAIRRGDIVTIISDNENYKKFTGKKLKVTNASNKGYFYDGSMFPENLCDLQVLQTREQVPFACYEYELQKLNRNEKI